ncbi:MAG: PTS sugar transporter subunit IIC [Christensenellaceae bacterium]|jgi:uncharacterized membrane protein|nr:PTS sugar transporter subunit IIC [Christensenellaceae bacterium]
MKRNIEYYATKEEDGRIFPPKDAILEKVKTLSKRWFIDAFSGMALGLFATLIAGTIIGQIGTLIKDNATADGTIKLANFIISLGNAAKILMGAGIGAGIARALKVDKLTLFACMVAGFIGANGAALQNGAISPLSPLTTAIGNPIGAYITSIFVAEIVKLYAGKTKLDIILIPLGAIIVAALVVMTLVGPVNWLILQLAKAIEAATELTPFFMSIFIAVTMGIILTLPTSSAAIWVSIVSPLMAAAALNPEMLRLTADGYPAILIAGGASCAGCAAHMVGFAVASFRENKWSGLIAQGLGTSMLQIPNLVKNPRILIPAIAASAVAGPVATVGFKLLCGATGGGMGTSGFVGVIDTIAQSTAYGVPTQNIVFGIIICYFVIPIVVALGVSELLRKAGWIKFGDQKIPA